MPGQVAGPVRCRARQHLTPQGLRGRARSCQCRVWAYPLEGRDKRQEAEEDYGFIGRGVKRISTGQEVHWEGAEMDKWLHMGGRCVVRGGGLTGVLHAAPSQHCD